MWGAEEDDAIGCDVDRTLVLDPDAGDIVRKVKCLLPGSARFEHDALFDHVNRTYLLHEDAAERMSDEDDGTFLGIMKLWPNIPISCVRLEDKMVATHETIGA